MRTTLPLTLTILIGILNCNAQTQREREQELLSEIHTKLEENLANCSTTVDAVTDFNGKIEFWRISELEDGHRIIQIESYEDSAFYQEFYFERNGKLIYAEETENHMPINHFMQVPWNCRFYVDNGKLLPVRSRGHGKTEDDDWNPEVIFEMHKNRLAELGKIKR